MCVEIISSQYLTVGKVMKKLLMPKAIIGAGLFVIAAGTSTATNAQDENQIKDLLACDKIKNASDKLECFNAVIAVLKQQEAQKEQDGGNVDADRLRRRSGGNVQPRGSDFGLTEDQIRRRENARSPNRSRTPKEQTFTFTHKWRDAVGKYYFLMSNGQIWKEVSGSHLTVPKRAKKIRIKKNMMGGYAAYIEGMNGRRGKVKRVK
jgi:hypothetical protein